MYGKLKRLKFAPLKNKGLKFVICLTNVGIQISLPASLG